MPLRYRTHRSRCRLPYNMPPPPPPVSAVAIGCYSTTYPLAAATTCPSAVATAATATRPSAAATATVVVGASCACVFRTHPFPDVLRQPAYNCDEPLSQVVSSVCADSQQTLHITLHHQPQRSLECYLPPSQLVVQDVRALYRLIKPVPAKMPWIWLIAKLNGSVTFV